MVEAGTVLASLALMLVLATLGAVLLARFLLPNAAPGSRVLVAAVGGPCGLLGPVMLITTLEAGALQAGALWAAVAIGATSLAIGWPVAHFATRRLDRLAQMDGSIFD